jgi:putative oxidoreductase
MALLFFGDEKREGIMKKETLVSFAPLVLRLVLGAILLTHGMIKFMHLRGAIQSFSHIGIPLAGVVTPLIALLEVVGGLGLILGVGTRLFAVLLAGELLIAILTARLSAGFVDGYEFELALIAGLISLLLSGPGRLALLKDEITFFARKREV